MVIEIKEPLMVLKIRNKLLQNPKGIYLTELANQIGKESNRKIPRTTIFYYIWGWTNQKGKEVGGYMKNDVIRFQEIGDVFMLKLKVKGEIGLPKRIYKRKPKEVIK